MKNCKNVSKKLLKTAILSLLLVGQYSTSLGAVEHITQGNDAKVIADGGTSQTYIAIGDHAHTFIGRGGQEGAISPTNKTDDAAGAIAIGDYTCSQWQYYDRQP